MIRVQFFDRGLISVVDFGAENGPRKLLRVFNGIVIKPTQYQILDILWVFLILALAGDAVLNCIIKRF